MFPYLWGFPMSGMGERFLVGHPFVDETPETQRDPFTDRDILPMCEFNRTEVKRVFFRPWLRYVRTRECGKLATWVVIIEVALCRDSPTLPHDHIVMVCDDHKNSFDHKCIEHFECPERDGPTKDYWVQRIEKI